MIIDYKYREKLFNRTIALKSNIQIIAGLFQNEIEIDENIFADWKEKVDNLKDQLNELQLDIAIEFYSNL